ncbi:iron hydrogenase [Melampsora americana]|nr:iron hydrogenase [Melampsora americana]
MSPSNFAPSLIDLNDYLGPSQLCIKPNEAIAPITKEEDQSAITEIRLDETPITIPPLKPIQQKKAEISLTDCLACSGCVTSSESVLVALQSTTQLYSTLKSDTSLYPILSISTQSLASLSAYYNLSISATFESLKTFFIEIIGFRLVFDSKFSQALSLYQTKLEFNRINHQKQSQSKPKTILSSSCPGWICYAEKTQTEDILKMISNVKSSQAIQGSILKSTQFSKLINVPTNQIYHVTIMSCYDKKLEASRSDFINSESGIKDVDLVLTTGEVQKMLQEYHFDLLSASTSQPHTRKTSNEPKSPREVTPHPPSTSIIPIWIDRPESERSSSGGYLQFIIQSILDDHKSTDVTLTIERKRGKDYSEYVITATDQDTQKVLFKGAHCYGFKNLQNLVRKFKGSSGTSNLNRRRAKESSQDGQRLDYVEVMACPSGCLNGGGQISKPDHYETRDWLDELESKYLSSSPSHPIMIKQDEEIEEWLKKWFPDQEDHQNLFTTQYRVVPIETNGFAVQW